MSLDDLGRRAANDARTSTSNAHPPGLAAVQSTARRRRWMALGALAAGAVTAVAAFAAIAGTLGGTDVTPRISDPAETTSTIAAETTTTASVTGPDYAVLPGLGTETAELLPPPPHRDAAWLTEETLMPAVVETLREAVGIERDVRNIVAAFQTKQAIYAIIHYAGGDTGYLVIDDQTGTARLRVGSGSWVDRHMLRQGPSDWSASTQVTWLGLPDEAVLVTLTRPQPPTITEQAVVGGAAFFEMLKPDWNQYGELAAYDANGNLLLQTQVLLDGRSCSSGGSQPPAIVYSTAPDAVEQNRADLQDAAARCRFSQLEEMATGAGPYFGLPTDDLSAALREADRYYPLLLDIYDTAKLRHRTVESEQGTVYVWDTDTMEIGFLEDGTWQYGIIKGDHPQLSGTS